jgi:hypothetical protein
VYHAAAVEEQAEEGKLDEGGGGGGAVGEEGGPVVGEEVFEVAAREVVDCISSVDSQYLYTRAGRSGYGDSSIQKTTRAAIPLNPSR